MQKLLAYFRDDRPKFKKKDQELGEVAIKVLKYQDHDQLNALKETLYVAVPTLSTVGELKQRLFGITSISKSKIRLMLCGSALSDLDFLPEEVFEPTKKVMDEDDDLYRPRLYMSIKPLEGGEEDDAKSEVSDVSELAMEEELADDAPNGEELVKTEADIAAEAEVAAMEQQIKAAEEAEEKAMQERNAEAAALEAAMHDATHKKSKVFSLKKDLERIMCHHFYDVLKAAGFDDEGAFSELTHEVLLDKGIWIPRKARTRMVALADSLKRRIDQRLAKGSQAKDRLNAQMKESGAIKGVAIEGIDGVMTNKKDINNAFKEQQKKLDAENREKRMRLQAIEAALLRKGNPEPKVHPEALQLKIDKIRWANKRDEFDVHVNVLRAPPSVFCCTKHKQEVLEKRDTFIKARTESNRSDLSMQVKLADNSQLGFVSRDILRVLAQHHFRKRGFPLPEEDLEQLLDECIVDGEDQKEMFEWTAKEKYRKANPFGFIPVAIYDSHYLVEVLVHKLEKLEYDRFVFSDEDKKGKYVINKFVPKARRSNGSEESKAGLLPAANMKGNAPSGH